jgi:hypothetical protein
MPTPQPWINAAGRLKASTRLFGPIRARSLTDAEGLPFESVIRADPCELTSLTLFTLALLIPSLILGSSSSEPFHDLLAQRAGANSDDFTRYARPGGVFAKILPHIRDGELGAAGAVRIPVTIDFFLEQFRDIEKFKKGPAVLAIGKFSSPPREQDLARLTLGTKDLDGLAACKPGQCSLKLSIAMMNRLRSTAKTRGGGSELANQFRAVLWDYLSTYLAQGTEAMISYGDSTPPVSASERFLEVLGEFGWVQQDALRLFRILKNAKSVTAPDIYEFLYWSQERFGLKPVVSLTDVVVLRTTMLGKPWAIIGSKQIYADHYFEASLGLTMIAGESANASVPGISVAYFNRSQTDGLRGWFASLERSIVERRVRSWMAKNLLTMRSNLGAAYRDRGPH